MRAFMLIAATLVLSDASAASDEQYRLSGSGTLHPDLRSQTQGNLTMRATLQSKDAVIASQPPIQEGGPFALMGTATAASTVCYNDTIFRDDFDGDGF